MAKTIDAAKREAGKKSAKKVKKNNRHVEAKPLMTLEEAREVLKKRSAFDTKDGADYWLNVASDELGKVVGYSSKIILDDGCCFVSEHDWQCAARDAAHDIVEAVEFMIAAEINQELTEG